MNERPYKTVPCRHYARGYCSFGSSCNFIHDGSDAAVAARRSPAAAPPSAATGTTPAHASAVPPRSRVCRHWRAGNCMYGSRCLYEHGLSSEARQRIAHAEELLTSREGGTDNAAPTGPSAGPAVSTWSRPPVAADAETEAAFEASHTAYGSDHAGAPDAAGQDANFDVPASAMGDSLAEELGLLSTESTHPDPTEEERLPEARPLYLRGLPDPPRGGLEAAGRPERPAGRAVGGPGVVSTSYQEVSGDGREYKGGARGGGGWDSRTGGVYGTSYGAAPHGDDAHENGSGHPAHDSVSDPHDAFASPVFPHSRRSDPQPQNLTIVDDNAGALFDPWSQGASVPRGPVPRPRAPANHAMLSREVLQGLFSAPPRPVHGAHMGGDTLAMIAPTHRDASADPASVFARSTMGTGRSLATAHHGLPASSHLAGAFHPSATNRGLSTSAPGWTQPSRLPAAEASRAPTHAPPPLPPGVYPTLCHAYFLTGECPDGERCEREHGDACEHCGRRALPRSDPAAAARHSADCKARHERLTARTKAMQIECGICLENVLAKPPPADRRFGLLDCDHPFCYTCVSAWRATADDGIHKVNEVAWACPICRQLTHFVTPSLVWPTSPEEKTQIIKAHKDKLAGIDCRKFDRGRGECPFGTSCLYRHAYEDGTLEDRNPRRIAAGEDDIRVLRPMNLGDFIVTRTRRRARAGAGGGSGR